MSVCVSSDVDALEQCELIRAGFDLSAAGGVQPSRPQQQGGKGDRGDGGCLFFLSFLLSGEGRVWKGNCGIGRERDRNRALKRVKTGHNAVHMPSASVAGDASARTWVRRRLRTQE